MTTHYRACNLCEAICGIAVEVDGDRVVSIRGDREDPLSRGYICPKVHALKEIREDPDRLRRPLRRRPGGGPGEFEEVGWDEAIAEAGARLGRIRREHGDRAVGLYLGNPIVHGVGTALGGLLAIDALKTKSRFSATSLDQGPKQLACMWMYGSFLAIPVPDVDRTKLMVIIGANPLASNGSLMTAPGMRDRLRALRARGGRVVVVDPRRTETSREADRHLFIRPGFDAAFLLSLLCVIFEERLAEPGPNLLPILDGLDDVRALAGRFPPERTRAATGVEPAAVRDLARELARADAAVCYGRVGTCTNRFGTLASWLIDVVNIVTGNFDRPGGLMFPTSAFDVAPFLGRAIGESSRRDRWRSRVRGAPEVFGELPAACMAEEIATPGEGRIRGLLTIAGNPVLSSPGGEALGRALEQLEAMVAVDLYLNETTRHAHFILPPADPLAKDHVDLFFHALAVRNTARVSRAVFPRGPGEKDDYEILAALAKAIAGAKGGRTARLKMAVRAWLLEPRRAMDAALRVGPYGGGLVGALAAMVGMGEGLTFARVAAQEHGIDLGPLRPRLPAVLTTPDKRIRVAPAPLIADVSRLEAALEGPAPPLVLIGRRQLRSDNSWLHNAPSLAKGPEKCVLLMNPTDAAARGLADGDRVRVASRSGAVAVPLGVTDEIMPGVASLPHGFGHDRKGVRLGVAAARPGASVNDVTDPGEIEPLSGVAVLNGVPIEVAKAGAG